MTTPPIIPGSHYPLAAVMPAAPKPRVHRGSIVLAVFGAVLTLIGVITLGAAATTNPAAAPAATVYVTVPARAAAGQVPTTAAPTTKPAPPPPPAPPTVGDGVWTVGTDLPAGKYRTTSAVGADCYWSITVSGTNNDDIIANDIPGGGRPQVTLKRGQDFTSSDCGTWAKLS